MRLEGQPIESISWVAQLLLFTFRANHAIGLRSCPLSGGLGDVVRLTLRLSRACAI